MSRKLDGDDIFWIVWGVVMVALIIGTFFGTNGAK